jgi:hypothetical protein
MHPFFKIPENQSPGSLRRINKKRLQKPFFPKTLAFSEVNPIIIFVEKIPVISMFKTKIIISDIDKHIFQSGKRRQVFFQKFPVEINGLILESQIIRIHGKFVRIYPVSGLGIPKYQYLHTVCTIP